MIRRCRHLVRRTIESCGSRPPTPEDDHWIRSHLSDSEQALWDRLHPRDQRHSVAVARRFASETPTAPRAALAGALLHDIGKVDAPASITIRILATLIGPRTSTLRRLHDHERHGYNLLVALKSDPVTIDTACGRGQWGAALRSADDL